MTDPQASPPQVPAPAGVDPAGPSPSPSVRDVEYKGAPLDAAKGPGLGCFWFQLAALALLVVATPLSVGWGWPAVVSGALLIVTLVLLLFAGQTVIFLLRLVAADRRAELRRAPLASRTPTVGQIEDEHPTTDLGTDPAAPTPPAIDPAAHVTPASPPSGPPSDRPGGDGSAVRE